MATIGYYSKRKAINLYFKYFFRSEAIATSEYIRPDPAWSPQPGPSLPFVKLHTCFTKLNATHGFLIGGQAILDSLTHAAAKETLFYNIDGNTYMRLKSMAMVCFVFISRGDMD